MVCTYRSCGLWTESRLLKGADVADPTYPLERIREAAVAKQLEFDVKRAKSELALVIDSLLEGYQFGAALLLELQLDDFCEVVELGPPHAGIYDVYGVRVSAALASRFGVPRCWYVKFKLIETELNGETVFFVSLHRLNKPMSRNGGMLKPE